jgi:uncharacterized membrane protein YhaH (DUF805 family)
MKTGWLGVPRLRRRMFWLWTTIAWLVFYSVREGANLHSLPMATTLWAGLVVLALLALSVARLHDRSRSAWCLLAIAIPIFGALWLAWELALRRGSPGTNRYGPNPR